MQDADVTRAGSSSAGHGKRDLYLEGERKTSLLPLALQTAWQGHTSSVSGRPMGLQIGSAVRQTGLQKRPSSSVTSRPARTDTGTLKI